VHTLTLPAADPAALDEAARLILAGEPVALPTETVYGLAADAADGEAVARIYAAKGRPGFNPLIVHVLDTASAGAHGVLGPAAERLAERFWPGPLTLVLPRRAESPVAALATAGLPSIALRVPAGPVMRAVLERAGRPLAAPSANRSGRISPTRAAHVTADLAGRIALVVDGGPTRDGLESTIVRPEADRLVLLRPGPVTPDALRAATGLPVVDPVAEGITAPGQLSSHYAPSRPLRLDVVEPAAGEWLIGFGAVAGEDTLSASGSLVEAAARLFEALHRAEAGGRARIAVAPIPAEGLGLAIRDRLSRAAAPR
jgi:L-threonylcarbamoyladenylate synthase